MIHQIVILLSLAASDGSGGCKGGQWGRVVAESEAMILQQQPFRVPRDPLGTEYDQSCVRVEFQINERGNPFNIRISKSSGSRAIDMVARETIKKFKLMVPGDRHKKFALVFEYPADAGESP
ncbi:MAG: TonB family protein [Stenotrophomonas sp.]|uniref:TonB family protein n=1 Tax=Stenotrophomonas sp. TaxID=69392 RepID=UPI003D6D9886